MCLVVDYKSQSRIFDCDLLGRIKAIISTCDLERSSHQSPVERLGSDAENPAGIAVSSSQLHFNNRALVEAFGLYSQFEPSSS